MKRLVTLQDLSCAGKCSITVALPVLSSLEIETVVIPTSLLSNHTAFESFVSYDLSDRIGPIGRKMASNGISFDAVYTGYVGSRQQIDSILDFIDDNKDSRPLFIADPAMADDGKLYSGLDEDFIPHMKRLVSRADLMIPNMTEAFLLLGRPYRSPEEVSEDEAAQMLIELSEQGPSKVIITGIHSGDDEIGAMCYDRESVDIHISLRKKHEGTYLGGGDIFASVVAGRLLAGWTLEEAMDSAVDFVTLCIEETEKDPEGRWYGLSFEKCLKKLEKDKNIQSRLYTMKD